MTTQSYHFKLI